jgi:thiol:disulfide interchange protein DsbD
MGLTFSLTSFACVGPFVGPLLAASAQSGGARPVMGMAAFSTGLSTPFFLLAVFPGFLKRMPRSGGWLPRVKVVMGFVVLAVMLKYVASMDQVLQWNALTRERFLAWWVAMFAMAGLYLLGFLPLEGIKRDDPLGVGRLLTGALFLAFAMSLIPGMFGGKLGDLDAYVPVASETSLRGGAAANTLTWMKDDFRGALERGRRENKLVLVNFTGYACSNCHWMKANMFTRPEIAAVMNEFVLVELYTDGPETIAEANQKIQESKFQTISQPFYVILTPDEKVIATFPSSTSNAQIYLDFLNKGVAAKAASS